MTEEGIGRTGNRSWRCREDREGKVRGTRVWSYLLARLVRRGVKRGNSRATHRHPVECVAMTKKEMGEVKKRNSVDNATRDKPVVYIAVAIGWKEKREIEKKRRMKKKRDRRTELPVDVYIIASTAHALLVQNATVSAPRWPTHQCPRPGSRPLRPRCGCPACRWCLRATGATPCRRHWPAVRG